MRIKQAVLLGIAVIGLTGGVLGEDAPKLPSDAEIQKKVTGSWDYVGMSGTNVLQVSHETYIFGDKGNLAKKITFSRSGKGVEALSGGTWDVKDGAIVTTVTKTGVPGHELKETKRAFVSHMKVISLTDHELVVRTEIGKALMTLKKSPPSEERK